MAQRSEGGAISRFFAWLGGFNKAVDILDDYIFALRQAQRVQVRLLVTSLSIR